MLTLGDKVKVYQTKELKKWTDKKGTECIGHIGIITSMHMNKETKKVDYILDDNRFGINFPGSSLHRTSQPVSVAKSDPAKSPKKDTSEIDAKIEKIAGRPIPEGMPEPLKDLMRSLAKDIDGLKELKEVVEEVVEEDDEDKIEDDHELIMEVGKHTISHCKKINKLWDSVDYLGYAIWALVAFDVFAVITFILFK